MVIVRLFAAAREAAGTGRDELPGDTVGAVLDAARARYGRPFADVLATCRIWVNGDAAETQRAVAAGDEVAVLPPVSGGSDAGLPQELPVELAAVRDRRRDLLRLDDVVSYVRRVAQARADLAEAERARRRRGDATPAAGVDAAQVREPVELAGELRDVLADRLLAGPGRPPRPAEDFSDDPRARALDELCAEHGFGRLTALDDGELDHLVEALATFEARTSAERQRVHAELDGLTEQLVEGYHDRYARHGGGGEAEDDDDAGDRR